MTFFTGSPTLDFTLSADFTWPRRLDRIDGPRLDGQQNISAG